MEGREEGKQEAKRRGKQSKTHCGPPHGPHLASPGETQCEEDTTSPACHQRTFCKHSEGRPGAMVLPLCRATVETEASEGKAGAVVLPLCGSTVETEASEGKAGAVVLALCRATVETDASEGNVGSMVLPLCGSTAELMLRKWGEGKHSKLLTNLERGEYEPMNASERLLRGSHSPARGCENRRQPIR